jgi:hypothetical protein
MTPKEHANRLVDLYTARYLADPRESTDHGVASAVAYLDLLSVAGNQDREQAMMTMVDLKTIADSLRVNSRKCQTANGAALLQKVADWLDGGDPMNTVEWRQLWEHADRLCGGVKGVKVERCKECGGAILYFDNCQLCGCKSPGADHDPTQSNPRRSSALARPAGSKSEIFSVRSFGRISITGR